LEGCDPASGVMRHAKRLTEIVAGMTQEPRAAISQIEQEIGSLRDAMAMREQVLLEGSTSAPT
jgi:hypothetical protein